MANIVKMPNASGDVEQEMIINMEWGGFNSHKVPGASTRFDHAIDREEDPTSQRFEKQISGRYLGEITRKVCVDLMDSGLLFAHADEKNKRSGQSCVSPQTSFYNTHDVGDRRIRTQLRAFLGQ